jgi:hypothetical protein
VSRHSEAARCVMDSRRSSTAYKERVPLTPRESSPVGEATVSRLLLEITSGLPDDSREADERAAERRLRELRGRVKDARALMARTPGLAEMLQSDWNRAARFYARFGITEGVFRGQASANRSRSDP